MEGIWTAVGSIVTILVGFACARPNWYTRAAFLISIATTGFVAFSVGAFWATSEIIPGLAGQVAQVTGMTSPVFAAITELINVVAPPVMILPAIALAAVHFGLMFLMDIPAPAHRRKDPGLNNESE